jgi:8-oxo-dGTP pyrophosphatase MutT (NUDIX family)
LTGDPYRRLSRRALYTSIWLDVDTYRIVHPSGTHGEHVVITTPQSCGVIVQDGDDLLFTRQPRFAARRHVTEIVKGGQHEGESVQDCARRELREELGVRAAEWSDLGSLREIPSIVDPPLRLFLARDLEFAAPEPAEEESISAVRLTIDEALDAAVTGVLDDAVTVAALFRFAATSGRILGAAPVPPHEE